MEPYETAIFIDKMIKQQFDAAQQDCKYRF